MNLSILCNFVLKRVIRNSIEWQRILKFIALHYEHGFENCILLYAQMPEATYVLSREEWEKQGYELKSGAVALYSVRHGKEEYVFDVCDVQANAESIYPDSGYVLYPDETDSVIRLINSMYTGDAAEAVCGLIYTSADFLLNCRLNRKCSLNFEPVLYLKNAEVGMQILLSCYMAVKTMTRRVTLYECDDKENASGNQTELCGAGQHTVSNPQSDALQGEQIRDADCGVYPGNRLQKILSSGDDGQAVHDTGGTAKQTGAGAEAERQHRLYGDAAPGEDSTDRLAAFADRVTPSAQASGSRQRRIPAEILQEALYKGLGTADSKYRIAEFFAANEGAEERLDFIKKQYYYYIYVNASYSKIKEIRSSARSLCISWDADADGSLQSEEISWRDVVTVLDCMIACGSYMANNFCVAAMPEAARELPDLPDADKKEKYLPAVWSGYVWDREAYAASKDIISSGADAYGCNEELLSEQVTQPNRQHSIIFSVLAVPEACKYRIKRKTKLSLDNALLSRDILEKFLSDKWPELQLKDGDDFWFLSGKNSDEQQAAEKLLNCQTGNSFAEYEVATQFAAWLDAHTDMVKALRKDMNAKIRKINEIVNYIYPQNAVFDIILSIMQRVSEEHITAMLVIPQYILLYVVQTYLTECDIDYTVVTSASDLTGDVASPKGRLYICRPTVFETLPAKMEHANRAIARVKEKAATYAYMLERFGYEDVSALAERYECAEEEGSVDVLDKITSLYVYDISAYADMPIISKRQCSAGKPVSLKVLDMIMSVKQRGQIFLSGKLDVRQTYSVASFLSCEELKQMGTDSYDVWDSLF